MTLCSNSAIDFICGSEMQVINQPKMPTTRSRSAVVGGLPDTPVGWRPSRTGNSGNAARTAAARAARNWNRAIGNNDAGAAIPEGVIPEGGTKTATNLADAQDARLRGINPCNRGPACKVWMGIQACGVQDADAAMSLASNLFVNNFLRCLEVTKQDIKDASKILEKRPENDIAVEPHTETVVSAFHHWVKTCFWLNIDPEQVPFPKDDADAILEKVRGT